MRTEVIPCVSHNFKFFARFEIEKIQNTEHKINNSTKEKTISGQFQAIKMKCSNILATLLCLFTEATHAYSPRTATNPKSRSRRGRKNLALHQQEGLMKMVVHTDRYPKETSWKIIDNCNGGSIVMSGGNYKTPFTTYEDSTTLPISQYTLEIKDAYGDGICCGQGNGSFHVMFADEVVATGGQFGKSESQTFGSCPATDSPTASPTPAPTTCEMSYEIILHTESSPGSGAMWDFAYGQNRSRIAASSNGMSYSPGSAHIEKGCLPKNCYRFQIKGGVKVYSLYVDGVEVVSSTEEVSGTETSLFGTCESIM